MIHIIFSISSATTYHKTKECYTQKFHIFSNWAKESIRFSPPFFHLFLIPTVLLSGNENMFGIKLDPTI